jgi:enoyl-CoA hydratase/carnithine racemase
VCSSDLIYKSLNATLDEILDYEGVAGTMSACTQDAREGTKALLEKRKPVFKGH